jgi:type I restriction enzyme S subunit
VTCYQHEKFPRRLRASLVERLHTLFLYNLRPLQGINPVFYGYLLKLLSYITTLQRTGNFIRGGQSLNFDNLSQVDLFIPSLEEQKGIAMYFKKFMVSSYGELDLLQQQIEKLKEYQTTLFNSSVTGNLKVI